MFNLAQENSPCYNCLYQSDGEELQNCARNGVISPITGIIGSIQALEAMKVIMEIGETLTGRLLLLDGLTMEWHTMRLKKNPRCPTCGSTRRYDYALLIVPTASSLHGACGIRES